MSSIQKRLTDRIHKILRDDFGFFLPLGRRTQNAVEYALKNSVEDHYYEFGLYQGYTFFHAVRFSMCDVIIEYFIYATAIIFMQ